MADIFEMGVVIRAVDYFSGPLRSMISSVTAAEGRMASINSTMKLMGKSSAEINAINASLNRMADQKAFANIATDLENIGMARQDIAAMEGSYMRMAQYQRDMAAANARYAAGKELVASGTGDLMTGALGAFGIFELVKKAGEFQSNMKVIQDTTGASTKQMQEFGNAVMDTSAKVSKFNDMQLAQIAQGLTSNGFGNIKDAQSVLLPAAKFAEVQMYENKATDPKEITKQAAEMAHLFGHYDAKSFNNFLDTFNKYSMMQPGDSTQLEQTLKYLTPTAKTMGMSESDIMALSALDNRIGLSGSHGGTNAADMILRLIPGLVGGAPTKKKTPKAWQAMEDLGFIDSKGNSKFFDKNGKILDLNGMLTTMINDSKKMNPMQLQQKYHDIFGIQGGRAASILANPKSLEQLAGMRSQLGKTKSMEQINADLQKTPEGQLNLLKSNSMTLMLRVGQQLAMSLNPAIANVNKLLGSMLKFSEAHPGFAKVIGDIALFAVGGKLAEGVIKIFAGNFKMLSAAAKMFKLKDEAGQLTGFAKLASDAGKSLKKLSDVTGLTKLGSAIKGINFSGFGNGLKSALSKLSLSGMFKGFLDMPKNIGSALMSTGGKLKSFGGVILDFATGLPGKFASMGTKILSSLRMAFSWQGIVTGVRTAAMGIRAAMTLMMGPWGIVIAAAVGGAALLITHWSQITKWVKSNFGQGMPKILTSLRNTFQQAWNGISKAVMSAWNTVSSTIVSGIKVVQKWWNQVWPEIYQVLNFTWKAMAVVLAPAIAYIGTIIVAGIGFIKGAWQNGWKAIQDIFKIVWDVLKGVVQVAWYAISGIIQVGLDLLTGHWSAAWQHIKSMFVNIWNSIKGMFGSLIKDAFDFGKNFVMMIANGITGAVGNVVNAVKGVANKIKGFLGFHSPTKEGPASESGIWAPNFMKMFASGITNNVPMLQKASRNAANTLKNAFTGQSGSLGTNGTIQLGKSQQTAPQYNDHSQIIFQPGSIVLNPQPGQDAKSLARETMNELGKLLRKAGYKSGSKPVNAW